MTRQRVCLPVSLPRRYLPGWKRLNIDTHWNLIYFLTQEKSISVEVRDQEIEIDVAADQGWQDTGFGLKSGEQVLIEYLAGQIKDNEDEIIDGTGTNYICGNSGCCEPMVAARRSSLIGRIGRIDDGIFYITVFM